ncbi:hypothetical protein DFH29DRAFT_1052249 [Suillus ampliporus]|nr:hypothetical protein DFH29DRAFT_1052249 [Suillus ampliporus]
MHSGSWHNRYPGDSRIVLDLISLYDTALEPSLVPVRAGLERCDHRVLRISSEDISQFMRKLTEVVTRQDPVGSGIDWKTLIRGSTRVDAASSQFHLIRLARTASASEAGPGPAPYYAYAVRHFRNKCIAVGIPDVQALCHNTYFGDDKPKILDDVFGAAAAESRRGHNERDLPRHYENVG